MPDGSETIVQAILENPIERVLILLLVIGVFMLWKRLTAMQDKYTELLKEVVAVMERVPDRIDASWRQAVVELKLHLQQLLG